MVKTKKKVIFIIIIAVLIVAGCSLLVKFDAPSYVIAVLDQNLKGDVEQAAAIIEDTTEEELSKQYEARIKAFVEDTLTSGIEVDQVLASQYEQMCKSIFKDLKYKTIKSEKISRSEYEVDVEMQPVDVFLVFEEAVKADSVNIVEKAKNGEYKGNEEEITTQMQIEFVTNAYKLLETSYDSMKYGKKETYVFNVKCEEGEDFEIKEEVLSDFINQILRLDEIQD